MKLHEAIIKVINESRNGAMSASEIAAVINSKKYYVKSDKSLIASSQISARVNNYKGIFRKISGKISLLNGSTVDNVQITKPVSVNLLPFTADISDWILLEKMLMNKDNFKDCKKSEKIIPDKPGIYCIRIKNGENLPGIFARVLELRGHNIIYIGIASKSLKTRFFNQELRAKGHGTFFRSLGAVLHFRPLKGSLVEKSNKRNYKFTPQDEKEIIKWINNNLLINWIEMSDNVSEFETQLILKYKPLLNIAKNTVAIPELSGLRAECVRIANGI